VRGDHQRAIEPRGFRPQHIGDLLAVLGVEIARGLVGEHDGRLVRKRPGNGDPLLLAAGKRIREGVQPASKTKRFQSPPRPRHQHAPIIQRQGKLNVFQHV